MQYNSYSNYIFSSFIGGLQKSTCGKKSKPLRVNSVTWLSAKLLVYVVREASLVNQQMYYNQQMPGTYLYS